MSQNNTLEIAEDDFSRIRLDICGQNNRVRIGKLRSPGNGVLEVRICGSDCDIEIGAGTAIGRRLQLIIGNQAANFTPADGVKLSIGRNNSFEDVRCITFNSTAEIIIGHDCMFSEAINLYHTDAHPIFSRDDGHILNRPRRLSIGNHCWIGAQATLLKNVELADDCIVGWGAVVSRSVTQSGSTIFGNPAQAVCKNTGWRSDSREYCLPEDIITADEGKYKL